MEINKVEEIQAKINLLQLELSQTKDQTKRNSLSLKIQLKKAEKEVQRIRQIIKNDRNG